MTKSPYTPYREYAADLAATLSNLPWERIHAVATVLHDARLTEKQIFVVGNGGSAATASHLACDLNKNTFVQGFPRFRVLSLTDNMAHFSAAANDYGYENVFAEQLSNFLRPEDIVIAISTSGNSPNVLKAVEMAHAHAAYTIGWTGAGGGRLAQVVHMPVVVQNESVEQVEDLHLILQHMLTKALRELAQNAMHHDNRRNGDQPSRTAVMPISYSV